MMEMMTSWELKGLKQGLKQGKQEGKGDIVALQIRKRFGVLTGDTAARLGKLTSRQLSALGEALLDFTSIADLEQWLARRS